MTGIAHKGGLYTLLRLAASCLLLLVEQLALMRCVETPLVGVLLMLTTRWLGKAL